MMQITETYQLTNWITEEIVNAKIVKLYNGLHTV